jgi:ParB-like chromosome segregation protein Spo0J
MASMGTKYNKGDKQGMTVSKSFAAPPQSIRIIDGHNYRAINDERVAMFALMYQDKKAVPPILVAVGEDETLELVDGEHRLRAALLAGVDKIQMVEFTGAPEERQFAAWRFNQGTKGTPVENAKAMERARASGYSMAAIAREMGVSEGTVANHLLLAASGDAVMEMVEKGTVAATTAINTARQVGPDKVLAALTKVDTATPPKPKAKPPAKLYDVAGLLAALQHIEVVGKVNLPNEDADRSLTLRCPAGEWRTIQQFIKQETGR